MSVNRQFQVGGDWKHLTTRASVFASGRMRAANERYWFTGWFVMEILLLIAALAVTLFSIPSFSVLRGWNEEKGSTKIKFIVGSLLAIGILFWLSPILALPLAFLVAVDLAVIGLSFTNKKDGTLESGNRTGAAVRTTGKEQGKEQTEDDQNRDRPEQGDAPAQEKFEERDAGPLQSAEHEISEVSEVSEVPTIDDFMRPILRWASEQLVEFTLREVADAMALHFNLSSEARNELTGEGDVDRVYDRTSRSINPHLKEAGLVYSVRKEYWKITAIGKKEAFASDERMSTDYLIHNFPAYRLWKESGKTDKE